MEKPQKTLFDFKKEYVIKPDFFIPQDKKPVEEVIKRRKNQKEQIMELLAEYDSIPVFILVKKGIYQYNARINELNKELAGVNKEIVSVEVNGLCSKRLEVV